ncbi:hypothetical protein ACMXYV_05620 [Neptuniibacter sp. SY11_33]|uniref:hypothetical protein n=1 Tax=Neptuniibacter sp. SY11_33 TaxID=3398215 RepID=UPI0039F4EE79
MESRKIINSLMEELGSNSLDELAALTGLKLATLTKVAAGERELKEKQIVSMIVNSMKKHSEISISNSIKPIVEFFEIDHAESKRGAYWEILPTTINGNSRYDQIRKKLNSSQGIYFFYNSAGKVIYAGKTETQGLWKEMKNAFNRDRASQNVYLAEHPTRGIFYPASEKPVQIKKSNVYLHDLAFYFSAYEVDPSLIHNLEAFIVRTIPNDITNTRMEKFKYQ